MREVPGLHIPLSCKNISGIFLVGMAVAKQRGKFQFVMLCFVDIDFMDNLG